MPRAAELKTLNARPRDEITLKELRDRLGGPGVSDEQFLLRYIMKGEQEIEAMLAAGPPKRYYGSTMPLLTLLQELDKHRHVRYVHVQRGDSSLTLRQRASVQ
jgi:oxaloacetate decarboxylase alpha subunit